MPFPLIPLIAGGAALAGGLMSAFGKSKPSNVKQLPRFSPFQTGIMNRLATQGMENADFSGMENRARQMFQTQGLPSIAERFTSAGAGGQRSSAFMPAMFGAQADLESQLGALRGQFGLQQLGLGLQPQFESIFRPSQQGAMQTFGQGLMGGGMQALGPAMQGYNQESALDTLGQMQNSKYNDLLGKYNDLLARFSKFSGQGGMQ